MNILFAAHKNAWGGFLNLVRAQLVKAESAIESAQLRRQQILTRLNYLNQEENMPAYEVTLKSVDAITGVHRCCRLSRRGAGASLQRDWAMDWRS